MKWTRNALLIIFSLIMLASMVSCSKAGTTTSSSRTTSTPSTTTSTYSLTPTSTPTVVVTPSPASTFTTAPSTAPPAQNPADNRTFYTANTISGYTTTYNIDGTTKQTPIYKDLFFDLNLVGYYTPKDAIFVPRIPTLTTHDDWFVRPQFSGYFLKSWIFNWGYTLDTSVKTSEPVTLSFTIYVKDDFDKIYYLNPGNLLYHDLKGDITPSVSGIQCKWLENTKDTVIYPKDFVFLIRTNNASAIKDWWIKVGTEGKITLK